MIAQVLGELLVVGAVDPLEQLDDRLQVARVDRVDLHELFRIVGLVVAHVGEPRVRVGLVQVTSPAGERPVVRGDPRDVVVVGHLQQQPRRGGSAIDRVHGVGVTLRDLIGGRGEREGHRLVDHRRARAHRQRRDALVAASVLVLVEAEQQRQGGGVVGAELGHPAHHAAGAARRPAGSARLIRRLICCLTGRVAGARSGGGRVVGGRSRGTIRTLAGTARTRALSGAVRTLALSGAVRGAPGRGSAALPAAGEALGAFPTAGEAPPAAQRLQRRVAFEPHAHVVEDGAVDRHRGVDPALLAVVDEVIDHARVLGVRDLDADLVVHGVVEEVHRALDVARDLRRHHGLVARDHGAHPQPAEHQRRHRDEGHEGRGELPVRPHPRRDPAHGPAVQARAGRGGAGQDGRALALGRAIGAGRHHTSVWS